MTGLTGGNCDLVVIDESHNSRNGAGTHANTQENRYIKLMDKVIRAGVRTKVLMLFATPVNNRFTDLKNQITIAYEGNPEFINEKLDTKKPIDEIFRQAQAAFNGGANLTRKTAPQMRCCAHWISTFLRFWTALPLLAPDGTSKSIIIQRQSVSSQSG